MLFFIDESHESRYAMLLSSIETIKIQINQTGSKIMIDELVMYDRETK